MGSAAIVRPSLAAPSAVFGGRFELRHRLADGSLEATISGAASQRTATFTFGKLGSW